MSEPDEPLSPCPGCGETRLVAMTRRDVDDPSPYQVRCLACDCRGSRAMSLPAARLSWQQIRPAPAQPDRGPG